MAQRWTPDEVAGPRARPHDAPADLRAREASQPARVGEGRPRGWSRRETRPLWVADGLGLTALIGSLAAPDLAWLPLPIGAAVTALLVLRMDRTIERWFAGLVGGGATLWTAAAWWWGVGAMPVLIAGLGLGLSASVIWLRHQRPRARVRVEGGSRLPWRRDARQFEREARATIGPVFGRWAESKELRGSRIVDAVADFDEETYSFRVRFAPGGHHARLQVAEAGSALGAPRDSVRIEDPEPDDPWDEAIVTWFLRGLPLPPEGSAVVPLWAEDEPEAAKDDAVEPAGPEPVDPVAERLDRLEEALRRADGPLSARAAAKATGLSRWWAGGTGLPMLVLAGRAKAVGKGWVAA